MNTFKSYLIMKVDIFLEELNVGYLTSSHKPNGSVNSSLQLYDSTVIEDLTEHDQSWLLVKIDDSFASIVSNSKITLLPICFVDAVHVRDKEQIKNLNHSIGTILSNDSSITLETIESIKNIPTDSDDAQLHENTEELFTESAENGNEINDYSDFENKFIKLASLLAVSLTEYKIEDENFRCTFDYSTYCIESWYQGCGLHKDKSHQRNFKNYCASLNQYVNDEVKKKIAIFKQRKHIVENKWMGIFSLIGSTDLHESERLQRDNDTCSFKSKKNNLDDEIFNNAIEKIFNTELTPSEASTFIEGILKKSSCNDELLNMASSYIKNGTGINDIITKYPKLRKTISLLLFASSDQYSELERLKIRFDNHKDKLRKEGIWSYYIYFALQNSYSAIQQFAASNETIVHQFKVLYQRLYRQSEQSNKVVRLDENSIKSELTIDGMYRFYFDSTFSSKHTLVLYTEEKKVFNMLSKLVSLDEYHSELKKSIENNVEILGLNAKFMNSFIDFGVNVDNKQTSNTLGINNKEITIQDIPVGQKRTHYKWSNWEAFLDLVKGIDNKNLKELKKAIKLSSSAWEHTLSKVTNNVKASRIQTTAHKCHLKKDRQETT